MRIHLLKCVYVTILLGANLRPEDSVGSVNWPMAGGPTGSWRVKTTDAAPTSWSVARQSNIQWNTTLPEGGQSGIAVWGDRLFLTCNKELPLGTPLNQTEGTDIVGFCLNSRTGKILWRINLPGTKPMKHTGLFSDNTCPTPVTDGNYVWFVNAGGSMMCCTMDGKKVWDRRFEARTRHNAKQCEPMLIGDHLIYVEMKDPTDPTRRPMNAKPFARNSPSTDWPWTFLRAFDLKTGQARWTASAGTSIHNTPAFRVFGDSAFIFHGRGGGHSPPEKPYGFTLTQANGKAAGNTHWNFESADGYAYFVAHFDRDFAYCFEKDQFVVLSMKDGQVIKRIPLTENAIYRSFSESTNSYHAAGPAETSPTKKRRKKPFPTNQTNIVIDHYCLFMSYSGHYLGRINIKDSKVEYLQVPVQIRYQNGKKQSIWKKHIPSDTQNSRGIDTAADKRAKGDGWGHVTSASPIAVNNVVFFSTMLGTVYVVDATAERFDESALISVNDSGAAGKTWTLSSLSYSNGMLFHRTLKEVFAIGKKE